MKTVFDIRVQKLFLIAFILKVGSSFLGWKFQDPWILGFTVPLLIMGAYIVLGYFRRDNDVTDEKFADTCYYLGFIFTITSIIFSLFDLPDIGTRIQDIAVRFGAAMVSTVLGLAVRVYLVSFKKDVADAIKDAEDAVLDATRKFTEQLTIALERLRDFETQVDAAAKTSVERVNLEVENLSKNHADKLTSFFTELTNKNQEAFTSALAEVKSASQRLTETVDGYTLGMRANLGSIEAKVGAFTDAVTERLKTTTFPDDYFAKHLSSPLSQLQDSSAALAAGVKGSLQEVTESTTVLSSALKKLRDKAGTTAGALETVLKLTQQQQAVLEAAQGQLSSLEQLGNSLKRIDEALATTVSGVASSNRLTFELTSRVEGIVADGAETRRAIEAALSGVTESLKAQVQATGTVVTSLDASTAAAEAAATAFTTATAASTAVVGRLEAVAVTDLKAFQAFDSLGSQATTAFSRVDIAVEQLQGMVRQLTAVDATLRARSAEGGQAEARALGTVGAIGTSGAPTSSPGGSPQSSTPPSLPAPQIDELQTPSLHGQRAPLQPQLSALSASAGGAAPPSWRPPTTPGLAPTAPGSSGLGMPTPGNGSTFPAPAVAGTAGSHVPSAPPIQAPVTGHQQTEQGAGEPPPAPQQPPSA